MDAAKRKWKRIKVDIRVRIRRWDEPEAATVVVRTYELSRGGMSVYASETLQAGPLVWIDLSLATGTVKSGIKAVVRNRRGFRLGMEFVDLSESDGVAIENYIEAVEGLVEI
jgi:c-di-GMP-binding flagellar brake protein YcgR